MMSNTVHTYLEVSPTAYNVTYGTILIFPSVGAPTVALAEAVGNML